MELRIAEKVVEFLQDNGYEAEVREDYSGRGMFGKTTVGIETNAPGTLIGWLVAKSIIDENYGDAEAGVDALDDFNFRRDLPMRWDSMGLAMIYY